ncbi:extracellular solute-binding protein [Paenibacillus whitsoniae]|uniref:Extracellular solute-binding protein n=1 Tax=Paenibacillus whitsoniae TaxID=2496558 RepID=A0A430JBB9_9BACL|nr:extracellular solute-binding protein [Paenibacillus whitsoniae]RTE08282.1 extracellular solute-binding protein [Paenibacillus whitsoniae]
MKTMKALIALTVVSALAAACSDKPAQQGAQETAQSTSTGQNASASPASPAAAKTDPYKLPNPVEITTFKGVTPGAKLPSGDTVEDNQYTRYIKDKTNISFKLLWYASGQDYTQKLKLAVASNDLPDMMLVDEQTFLSLAEAGQLEDLTKVYDAYAAPLTKELYASTQNKALDKAKYGGKLLAIPNISVQADSVSMVWVRKDWLDKLGLQPPKTMDDLVNVAKAFVEKDPDGNGKADTIGMTGSDTALSMPGKASFHNFKPIFEAYNAFPSNWIKDKSGSVVYGSIQPETKEALAKLRDMYAAGLIDKEFALRKDLNAPVVSGQAGIFLGPWWAGGMLMDTYTNNPKANFIPLLLPDAKGKVNNLMVPVSNTFLVMKKGVKTPEAAVVYANTFIAAQRKTDPDALKLDFTIDATYWPIGNATFDYADAVERKADMLKKALTGETKPESLTPEVKVLYDYAKQDQANPRGDLKVWKSYYGYTEPAEVLKQPRSNIYSEFTATTKTMDRKWANLQKLESETFFKIVMGQQPLDSFDKFVTDWKSQGGDDITKEVRDEISKK